MFRWQEVTAKASTALCWRGGRLVSRFSFLQVFFFFSQECILYFSVSSWMFVGSRPPKNLIKQPFLKGDSLCISADIGAPPSTLHQISFRQHTHGNTHTRTSPVPLPLDFFIDVPYVSHHGVGTPLQGPGGQGQLDAELLHVGSLCDGCQSVGTPAQEEVTEGGLNGGHVRTEEGVLNLGG